MASNDPTTCPLCCGLGRVPRQQLLSTLADPNLNQKVAQAVVELTKPREPAAVSAGQPSPGNFERDVHSWNPAQPLWRRSPKE
jgi:hypothetical protein